MAAVAHGLQDRHAAEQRAEPGDVDADAPRARAIAHVERQDERDPQLQQLRRQVQVALEVGRVDDVDDGAGVTAEEIVAVE